MSKPDDGSPGFGVVLRRPPALIAAVLIVAAASIALLTQEGRGFKAPSAQHREIAARTKRTPSFLPTPAQWASLTVETVQTKVFRPEIVTEGKIGIDEDTSTPVFSPYPGRVTRLLSKPGDEVKAGQPLFLLEAVDMVQAQNDFLAATANLTKARSNFQIKTIIEKQNKTLYESRAASLRDWQQSQADVAQAQSDINNGEAALESARNRLRILGKTDQEISEFQAKGKISPETPIYSPITGSVVSRKIGPGQYVSYTSIGSVDPAFIIGNLSTVWLVAYVRESDAPKIKLGQTLDFVVHALPDRTFHANIAYVSPTLDPVTRRLMVRSTIDNTTGLFKPEMFASVTVYTDEGDSSPAIPRSAVIQDADNARVWVVRDDKSIALRQIKLGTTARGDLLQVLDGLKVGEKVVTKGAIFIDQAAGG